MTTQEKLIEGMKAAFPGESQAALARRAGLSVQRFNNYCTGIRTMDIDAVIGCAQALGWEIRATVAAHEIETAPSPRVKAMWRKLAAVAITLAPLMSNAGEIERNQAFTSLDQRAVIVIAGRWCFDVHWTYEKQSRHSCTCIHCNNAGVAGTAGTSCR